MLEPRLVLKEIRAGLIQDVIKGVTLLLYYFIIIASGQALHQLSFQPVKRKGLKNYLSLKGYQ